MNLRRAIIVSLLAFAASSQSVAAQSSIDFGAFVALYRPQTDFDPAAYYTTRLPSSPQQLGGVAWGLHLRRWLTQHLGLQGHFAVSTSTAEGVFTPGGGTTPERRSRVVTSSVLIVARRDSAVRGTQIYVGAGPGVIHHGGDAYESFRTPVQLASVLAAGVTIPISSRLAVDAGVTTLLYSIDVSDEDGVNLQHGFQMDPLMHVGLRWRLP